MEQNPGDSRPAAAMPPHNLPSYPTSFVGRESEIAAVLDLLQESRLITLTGMSGAGKTRLAVETALRSAPRFTHGAWMIRFSQIDDPADVPAAVAATLGVRTGDDSRGRPSPPTTGSLVASLAARAEGRRALVLFDDCAHVGEAVAELALAILERNSEMTVLTTGLQPLAIPGERVWSVPPLDTPEPDAPLDRISASDSVLLFVDRARTARPGFDLTAANASDVASVCRRLEGNPLAIELAAARVSALSVQQIGERLDDQFRILTRRGPGDDTSSGIFAAIEAGYDLLTDAERRTFERIAVFPGTFTLAAAEAVTQGPDLPAAEVLDAVTGLIEKSMLLADEPFDEQLRYRMPRLLRAYAEQRLEASGETAERRRRHAAHYLATAAGRAADQFGASSAAALAALEKEHHNYRAALDRALHAGDAETAQCFVGTLYWLWFVRWYRDGYQLAEAALALEGPVDEEVRARAHVGSGLLAGIAGRPTRASELLETGRRLYREAGLPFGEGEALLYTGIGLQLFGDLSGADAAFGEAGELFLRAGSELGVAWSRWLQATNARRAGDEPGAEEYATQALAVFEDIADGYGIANALLELGALLRHRGDIESAIEFHARALGIFRDLGDRGNTAAALAALAVDERELGNLTAAEGLLIEGLEIAETLEAPAAVAEARYLLGDVRRRRGDPDAAEGDLTAALEVALRDDRLPARHTTILALEALAGVAADTGRYGRAVRLAGAASALRERYGRPPGAQRRHRLEQLLITARKRLGNERYEALWRGARSLDRAAATSAGLDLSGGEASSTVLSLAQVELGDRVARELEGVGDRREVKVAGIRIAGHRRRRPTGERPPLPIELRTSGWVWLILGLTTFAVWASLFAWPESTDWWQARDNSVLSWFYDHRTPWASSTAAALHALAQPWTWRPIRWGALIVLAVSRRWRHFFAALIAFLLVELVGTLVVAAVARARPGVPIIGSWSGYSHPSIEIAALAVTLAVVGMTLIPRERWRLRWFAVAGCVTALPLVARVYLGVDHPTDGIVGAIFGLAVGILVVRVFAPESVFPVAYRSGNTAHLDVGGRRGEAIRTAMADQLGIAVTDIEPFGLVGSGGSTPLRITVADGGEPQLFAKLYARTHLRADRWYKAGRTILYGALEDEVRFTSVRRLVEYEDYLLLTMQKARIPSAEPYGIVEITPEREYLIVTEFLQDAAEITDVETDDVIIDSALLVVRRLWDEGLAHRDIKPANVMVKDGRVRLIDVAFGTVRPTPWRQAVDLANMMMVLALRTDPVVVYERALRYFAPEDIAEAFAATRGITMPRQLAGAVKERRRRDGVDLVGVFRDLAPPAEPISVQRWSTRRLVLAGGALLAVLILIQLTVENVSGRGFL